MGCSSNPTPSTNFDLRSDLAELPKKFSGSEAGRALLVEATIMKAATEPDLLELPSVKNALFSIMHGVATSRAPKRPCSL